LRFQQVGNADHVYYCQSQIAQVWDKRTVLRYSLSDAVYALAVGPRQRFAGLPDDEGHLRLDRFLDALGRKRGSIAYKQIFEIAIDYPYGTKMAEASAPVAFIASRTVANTGFPKCSVPAFFGFVPPTTFVPRQD
jgi:hypothetical protein